MYKLNKYAYKLQGEQSLKKRAVYLAKLREYNGVHVGGENTALFEETNKLRQEIGRITLENDSLKGEINRQKLRLDTVNTALRNYIDDTTNIDQLVNAAKQDSKLKKELIDKLSADNERLRLELNSKITEATNELNAQIAFTETVVERNEKLDRDIQELSSGLTQVHNAVQELHKHMIVAFKSFN